nr:hypothetical protein [Clostridia bacterium]
MSEQPKKPWLSRSIDFDTDIAPYPYIVIYAGVGSGKNTLVDKLVTGGEFKHADGSLVKPQNVLLISSRRAKINEQLQLKNVVYDPAILANIFDSNAFTIGDPKYEDYFESPWKKLPSLDSWGEGSIIYARSCAFTNARTEWFIATQYNPTNPETHLWERFDMIVIDEAHSLLADASYQSSPFYIRRLIEETLTRSSTCKVILLTGTPQIFNDYPLLEKAHVLDRREICNNVMPKHVHFISREEAKQMQEQMLKSKEKFVAFFNHIKPIRDLEAAYPNDVAVSFSRSDEIADLKKNSPGSYKKMKRDSNHLSKHQRLPDDVIAFLTTSRNKEGINIKNEDIHKIFVETHNDVDIIQMAGRLRNPADILYVTLDSTDFHDLDSKYEALFSEYSPLIQTVNEYFIQLCQIADFEFGSEFSRNVRSYDELADFIDFIHDKFPYLHYDYFTNKFIFYPERRISKQYAANQNTRYLTAFSQNESLIELAHEWFPGSTCTVSTRQIGDQDAQRAVDEYLVNHHWLEESTIIKSSEKATILQDLNRLTGKAFKALAPALKSYGYKLQPLTKSKNANAPHRIIQT